MNTDVPYIAMSRSELNNYIRGWSKYFTATPNRPDNELNEFWTSYFEGVLHKECLKGDLPDDESIVDSQTGIIKVPKSLFVRVYKDKVFKLLEDNKDEKDPTKLKKLQKEIEDLTMNFSENSIFKTCPNIMSMLTKSDMPSAKEYLRGKFKYDDIGRMIILRNNLENNISYNIYINKDKDKDYQEILTLMDIKSLDLFGEHTLECLLVYTLSLLFNMDNLVSLSSLIDRIESSVRRHIRVLHKKNKDYDAEVIDNPVRGKSRPYPFGTALVEFLVHRNLLVINKRNVDEIVSSSSGEPGRRSSKKGPSFYRDKYNYAECTFNTSLLPIKLSLPMISPPLDWSVYHPPTPRSLCISDIYGGYLSNPTGEIFTHYRTMSSSNKECFYISFSDIRKYNFLNYYESEYLSGEDRAIEVCRVINSLQGQAFRINSIHLNNLLNYKEDFERAGLLMPNFLSDLKLSEASNFLREVYNRPENRHIQSKYGYSELVTILSTNMSRSQYEQTIIQLAKAYDGYSIYYPAFLDFRGRVYRSGIFHFHERDFARSLLLIENKTPIVDNKNLLYNRYIIATAFHIKNFTDEKIALATLSKGISLLKGSVVEGNPNSIVSSLIKEAAKSAKRPFQLIANVSLLLALDLPESPSNIKMSLEEVYQSVPITKDASASAYQIMSYFLLDETMAIRTNLIVHKDMGIQDIYSIFRTECLEYIKSHSKNPQLYKSLENILTRSVVKKIFMPIIYGKTINSTINDLIKGLGKDLLPKECVLTAKLCFAFWQ